MKWFVLSVTLLAGCAGKSHRDESSFRNQSPAADSLVHTREAFPGQTDPTLGMLSLYALVRGIANPAWLSHSLVGGRCTVEDGAVHLALACPPTVVILRNEKGAELGRTHTDNGAFQFKVEKNKSYWFTLEPRTGKLAGGKVGPFKLGDFVELTLKR